ncbi:MAG TPA: M20/M25/M40 family metallo-hydrolase [Pseudonocardiaceae bacterium]|nr:M20/M25/M40 family metallo-hydrolase [Pseudonocardiaceae bacterium]
MTSLVETSRERAEVLAGADEFLARLTDWLRIPSISADPAHHDDIAASARWLAERLRSDGWPVAQVWDDGGALPAVYACWPAGDPDAPTVLVYGHHDVQPVDPPHEWRQPPFEPVVSGGQLFARGASDDKGHVAFHLLAMRAHLAATGRQAPAVTVKLFIEGEEESGSTHVTDLLRAHAEELACDLILVSDTGMFADGVPSICTGMRGLVSANVTFRGQGVDLHSGQFGGAVPNPVTELARLVAALHDEDGRIMVPGFYDDVREPTEQEREAFAKLPFDEPAWLAGPAGGARATTGERGWGTLERLWVRPTAEVNGIGGGYQGPGGKTIVPTEAFAKLSFRLVPDQVPDRIAALVRRFVAEHTPPGIEAEVQTGEGVPPCLSDIGHPGVAAVREAMAAAFGQEVLFSREGGSGPEAIIQAELGGAPLAFLGVGLPDDRVHAPNEKVEVDLLLKGAEATACLWRLLGERAALVRRSP